MRFDKLTTKFQQALSDAQSIAVGADNTAIEPQHLLLALLQEDNGGASSLLARAGVNLTPLKTQLNSAIANLSKSTANNGEIAISRDLNNLLNVTDKLAQKRGDAYIASEMFLLALAEDKGETGKLLKQNGLTKNALEAAVLAVRGAEHVNDQEGEIEHANQQSQPQANQSANQLSSQPSNQPSSKSI
jgi:ATP-dependent Clp protease ATP-binding subunit ClpB